MHYIELGLAYPAWRFLFQKILAMFKLESNSATNPYGHTYAGFFKINKESNEIEEDTVMNVGVTNFDRSDYMHTLPSCDYYLNNKEENNNKQVEGNEQNGILNRSFMSIVLPVDEIQYNILKNYYAEIKNAHNTQFRMIFHIITNKIRHHFNLSEKGNCCYWTSKGFKNIDFLQTHSNFPLTCFYKLLLNIMYKRTKYFQENDITNRFAIVFFKALKYDKYPKGTFMYPLYWLKYRYDEIWAMELLAHINVEVFKTENNKNKYDIKIIKNDVDKQKEYMNKVLGYLIKIFK